MTANTPESSPAAVLARLPVLRLVPGPSPVEEVPRLRAAVGAGPRILVKRDDGLPFAMGGNKVRKLQIVAADALREGADTLITAGGIQSNHCRVTAGTAAKLGLRCLLVANGTPPERPTANALLDRLFGADVIYVATREERMPAIEAAADRLRAEGRRPYAIPVGASTPRGALAFVQALVELSEQIEPPDVIVHSTSSGGTQAGLVAGCAMLGWPTRVAGVSADDPAPVLRATLAALIDGLGADLGLSPAVVSRAIAAIDVDDGFVGEGYGLPTPASREAIELAARTEALLLDPTYTAKAMAALIAWLREGRFREDETVLFWHTGGQVALFA
jgi:1-aminocyclopropane-1-carboxylate deaminase/D-cysteine desulfhydrase-like pyridoxal-dependent ACC family enzyme